MKNLALSSEKTKNFLAGREVIKVVTVPKKLVNIVIK